MLNLMLHCGARAASREQIEYSPTPERTQYLGAGTPCIVMLRSS
jgi:hypothetical protein